MGCRRCIVMRRCWDPTGVARWHAKIVSCVADILRYFLGEGTKTRRTEIPASFSNLKQTCSIEREKRRQLIIVPPSPLVSFNAVPSSPKSYLIAAPTEDSLARPPARKREGLWTRLTKLCFDVVVAMVQGHAGSNRGGGT